MSGENKVICFARDTADCREWDARRPPDRRQRAQLHHGDVLGFILHVHDTGLLLHDTLPGQRRASYSRDRLGIIDIWPRLGTECGNSVRHALPDRNVRMLLVHGDYLCDRIVVQTSRDWSKGFDVLHSLPSGYYVCWLPVCRILETSSSDSYTDWESGKRLLTLI